MEKGDCVITETGVLVGVVNEVGTNYAIVNTLIDTGTEMGGIITRTNSAGVLEGDLALMQEGKLRLSYLPDEAQLVAGDEVLTSGNGDVYPAGLVVGPGRQRIYRRLRSDPLCHHHPRGAAGPAGRGLYHQGI